MLRPLVQPRQRATYAVAQAVSPGVHLLTTGARQVNIWPGNIAANVGATVDEGGVTITVAAPTQVFFSWDGASAAGHRHRLEINSTATGSFTIIGRVNIGNTIVASTPLGGATVVLIDIPTAGAETGWSFRSGTITTGRLDCRLYRVS